MEGWVQWAMSQRNMRYYTDVEEGSWRGRLARPLVRQKMNFSRLSWTGCIFPQAQESFCYQIALKVRVSSGVLHNGDETILPLHKGLVS